MNLLAPTLTQLASAELAPQVGARFGQELRRLGVFTQLCLLGAETCLERSATRGRLGVLLATAHGARSAAQAALQEVMPFTFIATQTHLAGALLARTHDVARAACLYPAAHDWPWMLHMASSWLRSSPTTCERVALGWVEEATASAPHRSHWCVLVKEAAAGILCQPGTGGAVATTEDWMARVAAGAPELRGGAQSWRFTSHRGA